MILISAFDLHPKVNHGAGMSYATGSPFDGASCSQFGCHSGGATIPTITITSSPAFGTGNTYIASATYTINVIGSGNYPKYGFDLEILNSTSATTAFDQGTFGSVISNCQKVGGTLGNPTNLTHTAATGSGNTATFSFTWIAPASGTAYLYCAVNGVNDNALKTGDKSTTASMILTPSTSAVVSLAENNFDLNIFPNPATDKINIFYTLYEPHYVSIKLFNLDGKMVADLLNDFQHTGSQSESFDLPSNLSAGIYFVQFMSDGKQDIKKILVR